MNKFIAVSLLLVLYCSKPKANQEKEILDVILSSKREIESSQICADKKCMFLTFWDFDGTILKGDCSEGLYENNKEVYKGLVELAILKGYAKEYKGNTGFEKFLNKFQELEEKNRQEAYLFGIRIFEGREELVLNNLAKTHFKDILQKYYFPSSKRILTSLKDNGITPIIISASADFFVKGSYGTIPVEMDSIYGIEMKVIGGKVTSKEIPPVTYGEGKKQKIEQIVQTILKENKAEKVFILAGFGNSFGTDGKFLKFIAEQKLEVGKTISVMINGGNAPAEYRGMFKEVEF